MAIKISNTTVIDNDRKFIVGSFTTAQRDAIASPATGSLIFNTDLQSFEGYTGTQWAAVGGGGVDAFSKTIAVLGL